MSKAVERKTSSKRFLTLAISFASILKKLRSKSISIQKDVKKGMKHLKDNAVFSLAMISLSLITYDYAKILCFRFYENKIIPVSLRLIDILITWNHKTIFERSCM